MVMPIRMGGSKSRDGEGQRGKGQQSVQITFHVVFFPFLGFSISMDKTTLPILWNLNHRSGMKHSAFNRILEYDPTVLRILTLTQVGRAAAPNV